MKDTITIGIDGNEANTDLKVGIGQYSFQLLHGLKKISNKSKEVRLKWLIYLKNQVNTDMPKEDFNWMYKIFGPRPLWTQAALPYHLYFDREKVDVFFSPSHYAPRFAPCKRVISVMDLSFVHFPEMFMAKDLYQLKNWTDYSVKQAEKVLTISQYSKSAIIEHYKLNDDKVKVTYPGIDESVFNNKKVDLISEDQVRMLKNKYGIKGDYILFVGTIQPRKNISRLITAFEYILDDNSDLTLLLVGKRGWLYEDIFKKIKESGLEKNIIICDFVSNQELAALYHHAKCFVLPSLYEGFGIPVIEAMACGCPVVASNVTSLPEVVGPAGLLVDPYNISDMAKALYKACYDQKLRRELVEKGIKRVKQFSWKNCADQTWEVLAGVIN